MLNELIKMFSLEAKKQSFRTRIQRKIQDAGIELTGNLLLIKKLKQYEKMVYKSNKRELAYCWQMV